MIDVYPGEDVPAGAALHVAAHLAAQGWKAYLVTSVGDDHDGARLEALFEQYAIATDLVERHHELPTGRSTIHTVGFENDFTVHGPAAWDAIEGPDALPRHDALCYGTLAARRKTSRATMERLLSTSGAPWKVLDVNLRPPDISREVLEMTLSAATALKVSEAELAEVTAVVGVDARPKSIFAVAPDLRWLCVTRGGRGATLFDRSGRRWNGEAIPTDVVNTVGAGDAFTAGLIEGFVTDSAPMEVLRLAQTRASSILAKKGGLPDPKGDVGRVSSSTAEGKVNTSNQEEDVTWNTGV